MGWVAIATDQSTIAQSIAQPVPSFQIAQSKSIQGSWRLANMTEPGSPMPMLPSQELTADFAKGQISGSGGCNRFNGDYTTNKNQLKIGPLASTFKACPEAIMTQETRYLTALQAAQRYQINQDGLQIFYQTKDGSAVLRFTAQSVRGLW